MAYIEYIVCNRAKEASDWWEAKGLKDRALKAWYLVKLKILYTALRTALKDHIVGETSHSLIAREEGSVLEVRAEDAKLTKFLSKPLTELAKEYPRVQSFLNDRVVRKVIGMFDFTNSSVKELLDAAGIDLSWKTTTSTDEAPSPGKEASKS